LIYRGAVRRSHVRDLGALHKKVNPAFALQYIHKASTCVGAILSNKVT
jgi:hypothetical protein